MKTHNLALCSDNYLNGDVQSLESGTSSSSSGTSLDSDLSSILLALQDEFGQLSWWVRGLIPVILVVLCCPRWCSSCEFRAPFLSSVSSVLAQTGDVTPVSCTEWKERLAQARWRQIVALDLVTSLYFFCLHYLASEYSLCKSERRSIDKIVCSEYSEQHSWMEWPHV